MACAAEAPGGWSGRGKVQPGPAGPAAGPVTVIGLVGADWTSMPSIHLPERVSAAVAALGLAGQRWLAGLPELVSGLEADWAVTCGTALEGGNAAYVAKPAHDLGVVLRGWNEDLLAGHADAVAFQRCQAVSRRTGVDPESIWQWSYIERVSSGLFLLRLGHQAEARPFLQAADRLADSVTPWPKTTR
jgi:hypothetical protein